MNGTAGEADRTRAAGGGDRCAADEALGGTSARAVDGLDYERIGFRLGLSVAEVEALHGRGSGADRSGASAGRRKWLGRWR